MSHSFHLSLSVRSLSEEIHFFKTFLKGKVTHQSSTYTNIEVFGAQITLKEEPTMVRDFPGFHFGFNLSLEEFDQMAKAVSVQDHDRIHMKPKVVDKGTPMERKKMFLKCPTGYLIELKGYNFSG